MTGAAAFRDSPAGEAPPAGLTPALSALWWAARSDGWERAHGLVQDEPGPEAAWVHAHLHRAEGDAENAAYWYRRAGRPVAAGDLAAERGDRARPARAALSADQASRSRAA